MKSPSLAGPVTCTETLMVLSEGPPIHDCPPAVAEVLGALQERIAAAHRLTDAQDGRVERAEDRDRQASDRVPHLHGQGLDFSNKVDQPVECGNVVHW